MKTRNKALLLALCALLLVVTTVFATLAYLTDDTDTVKNTFTVGKVDIDLDETDYDVYGETVEGDEPVKENTYKLIPGKTYLKDPTIHVLDGSEPAWIFAKIDDPARSFNSETSAYESAITYNIQPGWVLVDAEENVYAYNTVVTYGQDNDYVVFDKITVANADVASLASQSLDITGYAIQAESFDTHELAWAALEGELNG